MKIIIAGAGDVGFHLAKLLSYESQDTYIIDFDGERLNYINNHLENYNVIVIGDLNDDLADEENINVFQNFINDSTNYKFVDMEIAYGSDTNFSKPDYPSHLDHILITNELFDEFKNPGSKVETIHIENYFDGGWNEYENFVSDHRPVGLSLNFNP